MQDDMSMLSDKNLATLSTYSNFQDILNYTTYALLHYAKACENLGFAEINVLDTKKVM